MQKALKDCLRMGQVLFNVCEARVRHANTTHLHIT